MPESLVQPCLVVVVHYVGSVDDAQLNLGTFGEVGGRILENQPTILDTCFERSHDDQA